jgi:hypothetical protein
MQIASTSEGGISSYFSRRRNTSQLVENTSSNRNKSLNDTEANLPLFNRRNEQEAFISQEHDIKTQSEEETQVFTSAV